MAEGERINRVLQERLSYLLKRPLVIHQMTCADFTQTSPIRPEAGTSRATNMSRPAENVVAFYNKRGTCEQWINEGKGAIKWTRLSCRAFTANAVRIQLHALAYNLGNFLRTLATPQPIEDWSLTGLKQKLIKIGTKVVSHGRYVAFHMAEVVAYKAKTTRRIIAHESERQELIAIAGAHGAVVS